MIQFQSEIAGKRAVYGEIKRPFTREGFNLCGDWEYNEALFDTILEQENGWSLYLRLPFRVVKGQLDDYKSLLAFGHPFLFHHGVHTRLNRAGNPLALLPDGGTLEKNLRIKKARQAIEKIMPYLY